MACHCAQPACFILGSRSPVTCGNSNNKFRTQKNAYGTFRSFSHHENKTGVKRRAFHHLVPPVVPKDYRYTTACVGRSGGFFRVQNSLERRVLEATRHATAAVEGEMAARVDSDRWRLRCEQVGFICGNTEWLLTACLPERVPKQTPWINGVPCIAVLLLFTSISGWCTFEDA